MVKKLSRGLRKFIRQEKTRIRREFSDFKKQEELISGLYQKVLKRHETERNPQPSDK